MTINSDSYILGQMQRANTALMNTGQPTVTVRKRPQTAFATLQQVDKKELKAEKPFRFVELKNIHICWVKKTFRFVGLKNI